MSISELFSRSPSVEKLEAELVERQKDLVSCEEALLTAKSKHEQSFDELTLGRTPARVRQHIKAGEAAKYAEEEVATAARVLSRTQEKLAKAIALRNSPEAEAGWIDTEKLTRERLALAEKLNKQAIEFVADFKKFQELSQKVFETAPEKDINVLDSSPFSGHEVESRIRVLLAKNGFRWAHASILTPTQMPEFLPEIKNQHAWILSKKVNS